MAAKTRSYTCLGLLFFILIILLFHKRNLQVKAQQENDLLNIRTTSALFGIKGSGNSESKVGGGFSKFKETISSIQRQQQQQQPQIAGLQQSSFKAVSSVNVVQRPNPIVVQEQTSRQVVEESSNVGQEQADSEPAVYGSVSGTPGIDFPNYTSIPNTKFSCEGVPFEPGMYADESTGCQVYHLCYQGRKESFLCGVGTVFNQAILNCDFWSSVECSQSSKYYQVNSEFGKSSSEPAFRGLQEEKISSKSVIRDNQIVIPATTKTVQTSNTFVRKELLQSVNRPAIVSKTNINRLEASSRRESSFKDKVSPPKQKFSSIEELQRISSSNFASPARRVQLLTATNQEQINSDQQFSGSSNTEAQVAIGSSNKFRMANSSNELVNMELTMVVGSKGESSKSSFAKQNSFNSSKTNYRSTKKATQNQRTGNELEMNIPKAPVNNAPDGNSEWKPYFKSNSSKTSTTTTTTSSIILETSPVTMAPPADQDPSFSKPKESSSEEVPKLPKSAVPPAETTSTSAPEKSESSSPSLESDVSSALTVTTPEPMPSSTTNEASSPPESSVGSSTTESDSSLSSTSSESQNDGTSTTMTPSSTEPSSMSSGEKETSENNNPSSSTESSVEYASEKMVESSTSVPASSSTTESSEDSQSSRRRKAKKKKKRQNSD